MATHLVTRGLIPGAQRNTHLVTRGVIFVNFPVGEPGKEDHISLLRPGTKVKIVINTQYRMVPSVFKRKITYSTEIGRRLRGFESTVFIGRIKINQPTVGILAIEGFDSFGKYATATIHYKAIREIYKIVQNTQILDTIPITHPGAAALGTKLPGGILLQPQFKLILIKF